MYFRASRSRALYTKQLLGLVVLCAGFVPALINAQADYRSQLKVVEAEINKLQKRLDQTTNTGKQAQEALREQEVLLLELKREQARAEQAVNREENEIALLERSLKRQVDEQASHVENLALLIHAGYASGSENRLKLLLSQQNPYDLGRLSNYYQYVSRARTERIQQLVKQTGELTETVAALRQKNQVLEKHQAELNAAVERSQAVLLSRQQALASLNASISEDKQALQLQQENKNRLLELLRGIERVSRDYVPYVPPSGLAGSFSDQISALSVPLGGRIAQRFGSRDPVTGQRRQGLLISSREGEQVRSVFYGRVVFSDWLRGYGRLLIIDHGGGYMSLYGHNNEIYVGVGDNIETGQVISTAGTTGGLERTALYFEIRHNGEPVDPARWLRG